LHDNKKLDRVIDEAASLREVFTSILQHYEDLEKKINEPFIQLSKMYEAAMTLIKEHYYKELEPELKKLKILKFFLDKSTPDNIIRYYKDK